jgi:hypothetical protein
MLNPSVSNWPVGDTEDRVLRGFLDSADILDGYTYRANGPFDATSVLKIGELVYEALLQRVERGDDVGQNRESLQNKRERCTELRKQVFDFENAQTDPETDSAVEEFIQNQQSADATDGIAAGRPVAELSAVVAIITAIGSGRISFVNPATSPALLVYRSLQFESAVPFLNNQDLFWCEQVQHPPSHENLG